MLSDLYMLPALFCIGPFPHDRSVGFFRIGASGSGQPEAHFDLPAHAATGGKLGAAMSHQIASHWKPRSTPTCLPKLSVRSQHASQ